MVQCEFRLRELCVNRALRETSRWPGGQLELPSLRQLTFDNSSFRDTLGFLAILRAPVLQLLVLNKFPPFHEPGILRSRPLAFPSLTTVDYKNSHLRPLKGLHVLLMGLTNTATITLRLSGLGLAFPRNSLDRRTFVQMDESVRQMEEAVKQVVWYDINKLPLDFFPTWEEARAYFSNPLLDHLVRHLLPLLFGAHNDEFVFSSCRV